jgi:hypothetical protein
MNSKLNKCKLFTAILLSMAINLHAQQGFQLTPQAGSSFSLLNKNIFPNKPVLISPLAGLQINKPLGSNFGIGIEAQYSSYNLGSSIEQQYSRFITGSSIKNFSTSTALNGLLNFSYTFSRKGGKGGKGSETIITLGERAANKGGKGGTTKGNNGIRIEIGAGVQRLTTAGNTLQVPNPFLGNQLTTVYRENKEVSTNPMLQLSLTKSWEIKPCLFFDVNVKAQYIRYNNKATYKSVPADTGQAALDFFFINNPEKIEATHQPFTFISTVGLRFVLGGCRTPKVKQPKQPKEEPQQPMASCFVLQWKNTVPKDSCFRGDSLQFALTHKNLAPGAIAYEIYIAPVNDLNKEKFLHTIPYPASSFTINPILMDANRDYVVIVKLRNSKKENECIQFIKPIKRCEDCCKDVKLPE